MGLFSARPTKKKNLLDNNSSEFELLAPASQSDDGHVYPCPRVPPVPFSNLDSFFVLFLHRTDCLQLRRSNSSPTHTQTPPAPRACSSSSCECAHAVHVFPSFLPSFRPSMACPPPSLHPLLSVLLLSLFLSHRTGTMSAPPTCHLCGVGFQNKKQMRRLPEGPVCKVLLVPSPPLCHLPGALCAHSTPHPPALRQSLPPSALRNPTWTTRRPRIRGTVERGESFSKREGSRRQRETVRRVRKGREEKI